MLSDVVINCYHSRCRDLTPALLQLGLDEVDVGVGQVVLGGIQTGRLAVYTCGRLVGLFTIPVCRHNTGANPQAVRMQQIFQQSSKADIR